MAEVAAGRAAELEARIASLQSELQRLQTDGDADDAAAAAVATAQLAESRDYARSVRDHSAEEVLDGCARAIRTYGFCVIVRAAPRLPHPHRPHP